MVKKETKTKTEEKTFVSKLIGFVKKISPVYIIFIIVYGIVGYLNPNYRTFNGIFQFLRRSSPTVILAIGQMFVLVTGGFDLSVGSLISLVLFGSSLLLGNDPENLGITLVTIMGIGIAIGLANGAAVSYLKVPSFITTLGSLLLVKGAAMYWVGGAPKGYFTDNFRVFGRGYIENLPIVDRIPYSLIIMLGIAIVSYIVFHKTNFGKCVLAIGDNVRTSRLSGVNVEFVRLMTFVISSAFAVVAGVLIGGFGGISQTAGTGAEMQAISAAVLGGTALTGGKGSIPGAVFGALTLEAMFNLLNLLGLPKPYRDAIQGLIIIGAVAYGSLSRKKNR